MTVQAARPGAAEQLIELFVRRAIREIPSSPARSTRNLIDYACQFSQSDSQRQFFSRVRAILEGRRNPYLSLAHDLVCHVDADRLVRFGINVGYRGCIAGARTIRETESVQGFDVPWLMSLSIDSGSFPAKASEYGALVEQGMQLGVYCYLLYSDAAPENLLSLAEKYPVCAFAVFCPPSGITGAFVKRLAPLKHVLVSVAWEEGAAEACALLRAARALYGVHVHPVDDASFSGHLDSLLPAIEAVHPAFTFICPVQNHPPVQKAVSSWVADARNAQRYATILFDMVEDSRRISESISRHSHLSLFGRDGRLWTANGHFSKEPCNIFRCRLSEILRAAFPR